MVRVNNMQIEEIPRIQEILEKARAETAKAYARSERLRIMVERYNYIMGCKNSENRIDILNRTNPIGVDPVAKILDGFLYPNSNSEGHDVLACDLLKYMERRGMYGSIEGIRMDEQTYACILDRTHYAFTHEPHYEHMHRDLVEGEFRHRCYVWVPKTANLD